MIYLFLNKERYENDIRALLMAFYHGEKILAGIWKTWRMKILNTRRRTAF